VTSLHFLLFTLRLQLSFSGTTLACKGTGRALGITDGSTNGGLLNNSNKNYLMVRGDMFNKAVGTAGSQSTLLNYTALGIVTDAAKSGIAVELPSTSIGTVSSLQLGHWYIKY